MILEKVPLYLTTDRLPISFFGSLDWPLMLEAIDMAKNEKSPLHSVIILFETV